MLYVFGVHGNVDGGLRVGGARFDVADVGVVVGDDGGDLLEHAGTVVAIEREFDGVGRRAVGLKHRGPFHVYAAIGLVHEVEHVGAVLGMDGDALAARDVADDLFTADGIA